MTIVSLELPESPIPLIESQANARWKRGNFDEVASDKDDILDEFLGKVTEAEKEKEKESRAKRNNFCRRRSQRNSGRNDGNSSECTKAIATLEECTRNIIEGQIIYFSFRVRECTLRKQLQYNYIVIISCKSRIFLLNMSKKTSSIS